jgi:hypothetical protein
MITVTSTDDFTQVSSLSTYATASVGGRCSASAAAGISCHAGKLVMLQTKQDNVVVILVVVVVVASPLPSYQLVAGIARM